MMRSIVIDVLDLDGTMSLGRRLGELLFPRAVAGLVGQLGAGKTHFVRAIAQGLGLKNDHAVSSPTFVLIQEYAGRLPIYHFDVYRLHDERDFLDLGVQEYFEGDGVCLIEWADKVAGTLPKEFLLVTILVTGENSRRFQFQSHGSGYEQVLGSLKLSFQPEAAAGVSPEAT
jgi:tRNA threonylcarbamoyladenosine biosynthesis protein TsaE